MTASRVVRPGVTVRRSGERSNSLQNGSYPLTLAAPAWGFRYRFDGVDRKNETASSVPNTKLASCCGGTPWQLVSSPAAGFEPRLQYGISASGPRCGNDS